MTAPSAGTGFRRIDGHVHLWQLSRGDYDWMTPDFTTLYRDFSLSDLGPLLDAGGMDQAVLVQAAATVDECRYLLDIAATSDRIAGVVGWLDMESPDFSAQLEEFSDNPLFKGVRPMIQDIADDNWMLADSQRPAFEHLEETGTCFDCLVRPQHLDNLIVLLERHPSLRAIIDHAAKPDIAGGWSTVWAEKMAFIAAETSALCKFSGLITEAGDGWTRDMLRPYADHIVSVFGGDRLVFGSDWPVLTLGADYLGWIDAADALLTDLGEEERHAIFGGNAARFYRL